MSDLTPIGKNKIITIRSQDRAYGIPSNFGISLAAYNLNPAYCSWHQVAIPNGFFNINYTSCNLVLIVYNASSTAYPLSVTIPQGNYTSSNFSSTVLAALNSAANTIPLAGTTFFSLATNSLTGYATLAIASPGSFSGWSFSVNSTLGSLDWILGFRSSQTIVNVTSVVGAAILDLRQYPSIYIRSSLVSGNAISSNGSDSLLCIVQNTMPFGSTVFQRSPMPNIDLFPVSGQLSQITFQLVDEFGHELNMDTNQDYEISICLYFT